MIEIAKVKVKAIRGPSWAGLDGDKSIVSLEITFHDGSTDEVNLYEGDDLKIGVGPFAAFMLADRWIKEASSEEIEREARAVLVRV